jgi:hypothetical protein
MKKLKLDLDDLRVESFSPTPEPPERRGTVFGQESENCTWDDWQTCAVQCPESEIETNFSGCCMGGTDETCWNSANYCDESCEPDCTRTTDVYPQCTDPEHIC